MYVNQLSSSEIVARCTLVSILDTMRNMRSGTLSVVFAILLIFGLAEVNAYETADDYIIFQPEGCEFSVEFPGQPKIESETEKTFSRHSAFLSKGTSSLGAVCTNFVDGELLDIPDETLSLWGWRYSESNGIRLPEIKVENTPLGKLVVISGSKLRNNWAYIYKVHAYYGLTSRMTLTISARTKHFPTPASEAFLKSIARPH